MSRKSQVKIDSSGVWARLVEVLGTDSAPEIARRFGITKQSVYEWQRGNLPRLNTLVKIAETHGVSLHWLVTGKGAKEIQGVLSNEIDDAIIVRFGDADQQIVQKLAKEENRTLPEQVDKLIAEALVWRGLIPNRYEALAPILQTFDELPLSARRAFVKSLSEKAKRGR